MDVAQQLVVAGQGVHTGALLRLDRLEQLKSDPFPRQSTKLHGAERLYRLRVGDYRIVYELDTDAMRITIQYIRHRREVYRRL